MFMSLALIMYTYGSVCLAAIWKLVLALWTLSLDSKSELVRVSP